MNTVSDRYKINYRNNDYWKNSFSRNSPKNYYLNRSRIKSKSRSKKYIITNEMLTKQRVLKDKDNNIFKTNDIYASNKGGLLLSRKDSHGSPEPSRALQTNKNYSNLRNRSRIAYKRSRSPLNNTTLNATNKSTNKSKLKKKTKVNTCSSFL